MKRKLLKNIFLFFLLNLAATVKVDAATYKTVGSGMWYCGPCWLGGVAPAYTNSDTIIIHNDIIFDHTLSLHGYLRIDTGGVLCGHFQLGLVYAAMENYGTMQVDTFDIDHSEVWNFSTGVMTIKDYSVVYNPPSNFNNQGGAMSVGPDFTCGGSESGIDENLFSDKIVVFPNPVSANSVLNFRCSQWEGNCELEISDVLGNEIERIKIIFPDISFKTKNLNPGIYFYRLLASRKSYSGRFVITEE